MFTGPIKPQSRRATYADSLEISDFDSPHDLFDWAAVSAVSVAICPANSEEPLIQKTRGAGVVTPSNGMVEWTFTPSDLGSLCAGSYTLTGFYTSAFDGSVIQFMSAPLPLV